MDKRVMVKQFHETLIDGEPSTLTHLWSCRRAVERINQILGQKRGKDITIEKIREALKSVAP